MTLCTVDQLLQAVRVEPRPQRPSFVFAAVELRSFAGLAQEAAQFGKPWGMVFAAAMSGLAGQAPTSADADQPLQRMVESIREGRLQAYIPFDPQGQAVQLGSAP
ncbi:ribonucleotide reductase subunit alpha [Hydrogenophaga sp.]|uniref:ribonucleotide reductase subunit alpha n=1 Tax=Hydrogenophaga sp. TaxID=1904254 RepID=UPI0025BF4118|nr:ribonucleotide reductase subunit alpha [Hydrogenophaga sp.]